MKDIQTLQVALKILKKGHKPCKDFNFKCPGCQYTVLIDFLADEIETRKWMEKNKDDRMRVKKIFKKLRGKK